MTVTLFPELARADTAPAVGREAAAPSFHLIPGNKSSQKRQSDGPPAGRRRVLIPPRPVSVRDRTDPQQAADAAAVRQGLKLAANDAIRAVLGSAAMGDPLPEALAEIASDGRVRVWLSRQAAALDGCQQLRAFREAQCGTYHVQPLSCHCRVCPDCERARTAEQIRRVNAITTGISDKRLSYAVLTVRNTKRLADGYRLLDAAYTSLRRRSLVRGGRCHMRQRDGSPFHPCWHLEHDRSRPKAKDGSPNVDGRNCPVFTHPGVAGGARFDEVTYHHDGMRIERRDGTPEAHRCGDQCDARDRPWHPHANLILDAPFIVQAELADTWRAATCPDLTHRRAGWCPKSCDAGSPMVWIKRIDPGTVRDAVKYVTKAADLIAGDDPVPLVEFLLATRNRRMVRGFGSFYAVEIIEEEPSEADTVTLLEDTGMFNSKGEKIQRRYTLPRFCRQCGKDTKTADGCTYEPPVLVPRLEARLRNGSLSWRPPPRSPSAARPASVAAPVPALRPSLDGPSLGEWLRATEPRVFRGLRSAVLDD